jgi:hypothetical protein
MKRILLFSYAFPPMQVQMTAAVVKPMAALVASGYKVDVICADSFCKELPLDESLMPFAIAKFGKITRLKPSNGFLNRLKQSSRIWSRVPDLMTVLDDAAFEMLMSMDLSQYEVVMTWSPFHSINAVMARVKKYKPTIKWVAQFSDPWHGNPLEVNRLNRVWNKLYQAKCVAAADAIVHSSKYSLELMLTEVDESVRAKSSVIPHAYCEGLFPNRQKKINSRITIRYVGVLYGRRNPEASFEALGKLFSRRPALKGRIAFDFVGIVPAEMLRTTAALDLPAGTVTTSGMVSFIESLESMYDADILVLIEAQVKQNLFLPSKISDYFGANTPIVGLVPPGGSLDAMQSLNAWYASPTDIDAISIAFEEAIDHVLTKQGEPWCDDSFRLSYGGASVANEFDKIIKLL